MSKDRFRRWASGLAYRGCILLLVAALAGACSDSGNGSADTSDLFGGTVPTDEELATYPKALPAQAFAGSNLTDAAASDPPSGFQIDENLLPPVQAQGTPEMQGSPGSCEVWSAGYAMGSYTANLTNHKPIKDLANTVSAAFVYMTVLSEEKESCGSSTAPKFTLDFLVHRSVPSLLTVPYYPVCSCPPNSDQCLDVIELDQSCANNPSFCTDLNIGSWQALAKESSPAATLELIKSWIAERHIVQITMVVPYEFGSYTGGVYDAPTACPSPQPDNCKQKGSIACIASTKTKSGCAQHGVAIVGYDDEMGAIKIQNSFGTGWGEQGFMWMSYSTFEAIFGSGTIAFQPPAGNEARTASASAFRPSAAVDSGFQWVDRRESGLPKVHLIFASELDRPLQLGEISITDPDGHTVNHTYGHAFWSGHHYVTRHDGLQFEPGSYTVRLEGTAFEANQEPVVLTGTVDVAAAPGESLPAGPFPSDMSGTNGQPVH